MTGMDWFYLISLVLLLLMCCGGAAVAGWICWPRRDRQPWAPPVVTVRTCCDLRSGAVNLVEVDAERIDLTGFKQWPRQTGEAS